MSSRRQKKQPVDEVEVAAPAKKKTKTGENEDEAKADHVAAPAPEASGEKQKSASAKKTAKASAAKSNPKKRKAEKELEAALNSEDDAVVDSDTTSSKKAAAPKKTSSAGKKSSAAKKASSKRKVADDEDVSESEEAPKKTAGKASAAKKSEQAKKASENSDEDFSDMSDSDDDFKPKKAGAKKAAGAKSTAGAKKAGGAKKAKKEDDDSDADGEGGDDDTEMPVIETNFNEPALQPGELKIVSWNVAGYRSVLKKGFMDYLKKESPDILCLQEPKIASEEKSVEGYHAVFFGYKAKPGHHGTAIFSKQKPIKLETLTELEEEGRVMVAEYDKFYLLNTYVPNSGMKLDRLPFRLKWDQGLQQIFLRLQKKKPVIWCGDLNVAHQEIDLKNPKTNKRSAGFTHEERKSFGDFLEGNDLVDTYRSRHPDETDCYTYWSYRRQARSKNIGWRVDYFIASRSIDSSITQSYIRKHILGSDHCPIVIHLKTN